MPESPDKSADSLSTTSRPLSEVRGILPSDVTDQRARAFCVEWVKTPGRTREAAIAAGYPADRALRDGNNLLSDPRCKAFIRTLSEAQLKRSVYDNGRLLGELEAIGFSDLTHLMNEDGALLSPSEWPEGARRAVKAFDVVKRWTEGAEDEVRCELVSVTLWDKVKALETLAKNRGMLVDRIAVEVVPTPDNLRARLTTALRTIGGALVQVPLLRSLLADGLTPENRKGIEQALVSAEVDG